MFTAEEVVRALYLGVFGREPDPDGLAAHAAMIADHARLDELAQGFHASDEHWQRMHSAPVIVDHSQDGEFPLLLRELVRAGQSHGLIVDVGARGRDRSNSYNLLAQFGWKGLLVEANPALHEQIGREFSGTDFVLVGCAVGLDEGRLPFFIGQNDDVSSLLADHAGGWGPLRGQVEVEVRQLASILAEHRVPQDFDILSLDIEGLDVPVLNHLIETSAYRPGLVLIEASHNHQVKSLEQAGLSAAVCESYALVGQTAPNLILARRG